LNRRTKNILALNGSFDTDYRPRLWLAHENARSRRKKTSEGVRSEGKQVLSLLNRFDTLSEKGLNLELTMGPSGEWRVVDAQPCEPMLKPHDEIDDGGEIPENLDEIVQDILRRAREAKEQKSESGKRKPER
jgi:hypothetical protein